MLLGSTALAWTDLVHHAVAASYTPWAISVISVFMPRPRPRAGRPSSSPSSRLLSCTESTVVWPRRRAPRRRYAELVDLLPGERALPSCRRGGAAGRLAHGRAEHHELDVAGVAIEPALISIADHAVRARKRSLLSPGVRRRARGPCSMGATELGSHRSRRSRPRPDPAVLYHRRAHHLGHRLQTRRLRERVLLGAQIAGEERRARRRERLRRSSAPSGIPPGGCARDRPRRRAAPPRWAARTCSSRRGAWADRLTAI